MIAPIPAPAPTHRLPGLDTLRGLAALAVLVTHVAFWCGFYDAGLLGAVAQRLEVGVAIFFVLSGFLLTSPWIVADRLGRRAPSTRAYLRKRAVRVLPMYWVTVVAALLLVEVNAGAGPATWRDNLLLVSMFTSGEYPEGLSQMWSLSTEVMFYLALPFLAPVLTSRRLATTGRRLSLLAALAAASWVWSWAAAGPLASWGPWVGLALPGFFGWFAAGMALAVIEADRRVPRGSETTRPVRWCDNLAAAPGACWMMAGAVLVVASTPIGGASGLVARTPSESVVRAVLYLIVAALLVLPSVFGDPRATYARVMASPALRHLGAISYSLFCCHVIVLAVLFQWTDLTIFDENLVAILAIVLGVSLVVSEITYRVVERPFQRLGRPADPTGTPAAATAPSAAHTSS